MRSGVPQGSILCLLLFICYIDDLPVFLQHSSSFLYADNTMVLINGNNVGEINLEIGHELLVVENWFTANKLSVNRLYVVF